MNASSFLLVLLLVIFMKCTHLIEGVPPEVCLVSYHCTGYCRSYGYASGTCRTKLHNGLLRRLCFCTNCDTGHCANYCHRVGRKYTGCTCFNMLERSVAAPFGQRIEQMMSEDCKESTLYCQCAL